MAVNALPFGMFSRALTRITLVLAAAVLACAAVAFALVYRALEQDARDGAERKLASFTRHHAAFMEDRARLARHPALQGIGRRSDAGVFLNHRVRWSIHDVDLPSPEDAPLALTREVRAWLTEHFRDGDTSLPPQFRDHDPSWMGELHRYDHWNIGVSPYARVSERYDLFTAPTPYFADLMDWGKLRALRAVDDGDALGAHHDIAQLARLCLSTETVLGGMVALALLATDQTLRDRVSETLDANALAEWPVFSVSRLALTDRVRFGRTDRT